MAEALMLVLLQKIATTLGGSALKEISSRLGNKANILLEVANDMKEIESEFDIMQAFISQVDPSITNSQIFESWLKHIRKVAFEAEDIIDEYTFLLGKMDGSESSIKKAMYHSRNVKTWHRVSSQLKQLKTRLQSLTIMKERYGIKITDHSENYFSSKNISHRRNFLSDSSYLNDDDAMIGHEDQARRLIKCLNDECTDRAVVSIYGMGGSGKTTLASSIYNNQVVRKDFQCHVWVSVSPNYQVADLLSRVMKQLHAPTEHNTRDPIDMVAWIQKYLANKRYLIVLDDMWDRDSWGFFDRAFTTNNLGSRVIITTRTEGVASIAQENNTVRLGFLSAEESWKLFNRKTFSKLSEAICPESLVHWAKKILEKCQGLPLAIVAIGSLLSYRGMEEQEWRLFYNQLNWQLTHNPELIWVSSVINLSLNDLPAHLRNCFLYCGLFPEDYRIRRKWIIRLWIAEGFVEDRGAETTLEEVAENYLKELIGRSLIQVVERNEFGRPKKLQVHDLVREITVSMSRKERFALICNHPDVTNFGDAARRVSVHSGGQVFEPAGSASQQLRSFLLFDKHVSVPWICTASSSFRLLRVLCLRYSLLEVVPNSVAGLFNLYYLDMSRTKVKKIPRSVAKLKNLQTLHLRFARVESLPPEVTKLTSLRHLSVSNDLFATSIPGDICGLKSLQTLREVKASRYLVRNLGHLTQLRSLGIAGVLTSYNEDLWTSIRKMTTLTRLAVATHDDNQVLNLEKLKPLRNLEKLYLTGKLAEGKVPSVCGGFRKLMHLSMRWSGIAQDPLSLLSQMPNLVYLKLHCAYNGETLSFCSGWFPRLTHLYLGKLDNLESIEIEDDTMKDLTYLELHDLWNFRDIPRGLASLRSLKHLYARNMPEDFVRRLQGDGRSFVQHVPNIECV